jgi:SLT domain-containing protein
MGSKNKMIAEKLLQLRSRIEDWASLNGYENIGNQNIRRDADDNIVWKRSDWEFVDDMYSIIINQNEYHWNKDTYHQFNDLWNYYKTDVTVVRPDDNPNLEPEWEQLQQMEWEDD